MCNTNIHSNFYLHIHKLVLSNLYQCSYWSQNYSEIWFFLMTTPPLPMTSSWLFKMPKLEKKNPLNAKRVISKILKTLLVVPNVINILENSLKMTPQRFLGHSHGLWKMLKILKKHSLGAERVSFKIMDTPKLVFLHLCGPHFGHRLS